MRPNAAWRVRYRVIRVRVKYHLRVGTSDHFFPDSFYLGHFSIAVTKHDQSHLSKTLFKVYSFRGSEAMTIMTGSSTWGLCSQVEPWSRESKMEMMWVFQTSSLNSLPPQVTYLPILSKWVCQSKEGPSVQIWIYGGLDICEWRI